MTGRLTRRPGGAARLRALLESGQTIVAPGAFDPLAARLVEEAGFPAVYMTGFGTSAALIGRPDVGLLTMTAVDASSDWTVLIPGFVLAGAGIGLINPPLASTAVGVVHHSRSGMASGINNTFRQVGIATGIAGLGAIFQHDVTRYTKAALATGPGREVPLQAAVLAQQGRPHLQDRLRPARAVPELPLALDPRVELPHQRLHQAARRRQPRPPVLGVLHALLIVAEVTQRLRHRPPRVVRRQFLLRR